MQTNLDRLCELFSQRSFSLNWINTETRDKSFTDPTKANIAFDLNGKILFRLDFNNNHFDFSEASSESIQTTYWIGQQILEVEKPWHPLFASFIINHGMILNHKFKNDETLISYLKGYLFASDLESLKGRLEGLRAIIAFKKRFNLVYRSRNYICYMLCFHLSSL